MGKYFGTDGVRGVANTELTAELAFAVGRAGATVLGHSSDRHKPVIVGRDTRLSGTMLESAIVAGITSVGRDTLSLGIVPTPAVAAITVRTGAAAGVMISASHNPIADNGIKFFGPDGFKLSDAVEEEIESLIAADDLPRPTGTGIGIAAVAQNLGKHYYEELYAHAAALSGLTVVVDGAFGAAYAYAPYALRKLGATVHELNCENDGSRINVQCGATDLRPLQSRVRELVDSGERHVIGVAFDGDADRAMFVDETGTALNGDHVMLILASALHAAEELAGQYGCRHGDEQFGSREGSARSRHRAAARAGRRSLRARADARRRIRSRRRAVRTYHQSAEQHDGRWTDDGNIAAFDDRAQRQDPARTCGRATVYPQVLVNIQTPLKSVLDTPEVREAVREAEQILTGNGRLLIRPSGTEPLIRVMVEGDDQQRIEALANDLADRIRQAAMVS